MTKTLLIIITLILHNQWIATAQEIAVSTTFSHGSYDKFQNNLGYEIAYFQYIRSINRLGFTFSHSFNNTDYDYTFMSDADGNEYYRKVKPNNRRIVLSVNYGFNSLNNSKSNFYLGPAIGLSYYKINETGTEKPANKTEEYEYKRNYWKTNKLGLGLLIEYNRKIISDNLSLFISTKPEVIFFSKFGLMGSTDPTMIGFINFNLGLKMDLRKRK